MVKSDAQPIRLVLADVDGTLVTPDKTITERSRSAVRKLADSAQEVLDHAQMGVPDVQCFIPHQANVRIIHAATDVLGFNRDLVFKNLDRYGNTSGGSIPIALDEARRSSLIRPNDLVLLSGFGAGLTWGTTLWRW